jgi:hypothetical protein
MGNTEILIWKQTFHMYCGKVYIMAINTVGINALVNILKIISPSDLSS